MSNLQQTEQIPTSIEKGAVALNGNSRIWKVAQNVGSHIAKILLHR